MCLIKTFCKLSLLVSKMVYTCLVSFCYDLLCVHCCIKFDFRKLYLRDNELSVHVGEIFGYLLDGPDIESTNPGDRVV